MKTDIEKHDLHGAVKSLIVETAEFKEEGGELVEVPWYGRSISFRVDGRVVEYVHRNRDGSVWRTVNEYSGAGKWVAARMYDPSDQPWGETIYDYDAEGRLVGERTIASEGGVTTSCTYSYDSENRRSKTQLLDLSEHPNMMIGIEGTNTMIAAPGARRIETRYDERDEAVEVAAYGEDGALLSRVEIVRDARGNPLEEIQYNCGPPSLRVADSCSDKEEVSLTEEQMAEIARLFAPGSEMTRQTHRYDAQGRVIESKMTMMGMNASHETFAYDEFGNKSEGISYDGDGRVQSKGIFTREYDARGNWTKEVVSRASAWDAEFAITTPVSVTRRVITYY